MNLVRALADKVLMDTRGMDTRDYNRLSHVVLSIDSRQ